MSGTECSTRGRHEIVQRRGHDLLLVLSIATAGGGIGGLAVAAFLRQHGYKKIQIYEARSREEVMKQSKFGNAIQLYFQCVRMLKAAGLPIDEHVHPCDIQMRRDDGKLLTDFQG